MTEETNEKEIKNTQKESEDEESMLDTATLGIFGDFFDKVEEVNYTGKSWGYQTGFNNYDDLTKGLHKSELTVVAGRHSMGKSSFVLNIATNLVKQEIPVLYVSYDLDKTGLALRIISAISEVIGDNIKAQLMDANKWEKVSNAMSTVVKWQEHKLLELIPNCYLYYKDLFDLIKNFKEEHQEGVVIIDYFQLVKLYKSEDTRIIELSSLAAMFKHLASEIEMPIILVSQVNKKCEERNDKRPLLSDLAECDALAQHCDNLVFIYRDEYYDDENPENKNKAELIVAKQKNGPRGKIELLYQAPIFKFKNPIKSNIF